MSPFACPELQCPFSIPYRCTNGLCVHYSWECPEAIGTVSANSSEIQCKDQSMAQILGLSLVVLLFGSLSSMSKWFLPALLVALSFDCHFSFRFLDFEFGSSFLVVPERGCE